jgi:hypothetical protein
VATDSAGAGIEYAYVNRDSLTRGAEWKIPFDAIGATKSNDIEVFAFLVNNGGYFANEIIPGDGSAFEGENLSGNNDDNVGTNAPFDSLANANNDTYHTAPVALPVELASFDVQKSGQDAVLSWSTVSETNNSGFRVQHAAGDGSFEEAGWVDGVGTTEQAQDYQFRLEDLSAGTHRFRLKQEDLDGSVSLSEVVTIEIGPDGPIAIEGIAPNPLREQATLRFTTRESESVTVGLYDVLGRRVETLHKGRVGANQTAQVNIDASSLSAGTYFLRVQGESFTKTERVTVAR